MAETKPFRGMIRKVSLWDGDEEIPIGGIVEVASAINPETCKVDVLSVTTVDIQVTALFPVGWIGRVSVLYRDVLGKGETVERDCGRMRLESVFPNGTHRDVAREILTFVPV